METYLLDRDTMAQDMIDAVQRCNEPMVVMREGEECLIAMRPAVFERLLFDGAALAECDRTTLHL